MRKVAGVCFAAGLVLAASGGGPSLTASSGAQLQVEPRARLAEAAAAIRARLAVRRPSSTASSAPRDAAVDRRALADLYAPTAGWPLWVEGSGEPTRDAWDALGLLASASAEGLDPADYRAAEVACLAAALQRPASSTTDTMAGFDFLLSAGVLRYLRHLHRGRIDPRTVGATLAPGPERHDVVALLRGALSVHDVSAATAALAPPWHQYHALRAALGRYRRLAERTPATLPSVPRPVRQGDPYAGAAALHERLVAFGDIPAAAPIHDGSAVFDETLADGLRRFQVRHRLRADGVLGPATYAALTVPLAARVRQIELALERLRWVPDLDDERLIALNIPMFHLWAWDVVPGPPALGMRAIVGRAVRTETPVLAREMRSVIFRPYWNVPRSILLEELLPQIERDPGVLRRHDFDVVRGPGDAADVVAPGPAAFAGLREGVLRLRQRPGPGNALGLVKFVFPNDADVYLHGTPQPELFARTRRDFSHGCVRVEDSTRLAEWVLQGEPGWHRDRIVAAMASGASTRVELSRPVRVILFYITAVVMPQDGALHFSEDVYGHDARLERALAGARARN